MRPQKHEGYTRRETLHLSLGGALATFGAMNTAAAKRETPRPSVSSVDTDPPIKTRMFWNWDHTTEWLLNCPGAQTIGASNYYSRTQEWFEADYSRLLEYCGRHHIDAVVVWGLLRDAHGGLESAKRLCEVAAKNNVRLLCGVGLCAYGGVYYQGDSPYSLDLHLQRHPELKAVTESGDPVEFRSDIFGPKMFYHACPSRRENQEHMAESLRWLFQNLPLHGVEIEAGDTGVCQCTACRNRRRYPTGRFSWEDFALLQPIAVKAIRDVRPDAWICCETYSHPEPYSGEEEHPKFGDGKPAWADECLAKIPDGVFIEWVYDRIGKSPPPRNWPETDKMDNTRHRHILRAHFGTYWNGTRGELALDAIAEMAKQTMAHGADIMSLFGEVSPFHTGAELNYLALENFGSSANPKADLDLFLQDVAAPLLGGEAHAHDYLRYARLKKQPDRIPPALKEIYRRCGHMEPEAARRWAWLGNFLASFVY